MAGIKQKPQNRRFLDASGILRARLLPCGFSSTLGAEPPVFRRGRAGKCRLQFSLPRRYECVNCRIPLLGLRFAATSCRASHAYPCLFLLDTDTGNCTKTCPTIMHPPPLLHLPSTGGGVQDMPKHVAFTTAAHSLSQRKYQPVGRN